MHIRLATRKSSLALAQSRWVADRLRELGTRNGQRVEVDLVEMVTLGDRVQDVALAEVGGKGLFVSELEQAMLENRADLAVHSLKDVPADLAPGLVLGCVPEREDARDVIVTVDGVELDALAAGERVGTSSLRRSIQLKRMRNDLEYALLRGNVDTRIRKLEAGQYRAIVLAYAGLRRLGLADRPLWPIPVTLSVPAVGQGALALECREDDRALRDLLAQLEHAPSRACVDAERSFLRALGGDCHTPVAGYAQLDEASTRLRFEGLVASPDGKRMIRSAAERYLPATGALGEVALALAGEVADALLAQGGAELVSEALAHKHDPRRRPS